MAFCTNCGKSLEEGARFCTNCGTPAQAAPVPASSFAPIAVAPAITPPEPSIAAAEITSSQPAQAPVTEAPISVPPVEASAPSSYTEPPIAPQSSTSPVFVIVCAVLLLLIAGGIAGTVYFQKQRKAKTAAAQQGPSQVTEPEPSSPPSTSPNSTTPAASTPTSPEPAPVSTPAPSPSAPAVAESIRVMNLGNYPGANPVAIATLTGETVVAGFLTRDTPQQVMQFYKIRFPVSETTENEGKAELNATLPGGAHLRIHAEPQGANTQVMILQAR